MHLKKNGNPRWLPATIVKGEGIFFQFEIRNLWPNSDPSKQIWPENYQIKVFFDDKFTFDVKIDTIIHSHVFEHVYYPNEFISHISGFLEQGQKLIFSLPNMEEMLK